MVFTHTHTHTHTHIVPPIAIALAATVPPQYTLYHDLHSPPSPAHPRTPFTPPFFKADVTLYVNATGLMWENAAELGALLVWAEHRFYGASTPEGAQLKFLTHEQALADYATLVAHIRTTTDGVTDDTPFIALGGSYGGMLASWARMKYPATFAGAIAGSAPILAFDGPFEKAAAKYPGPDSYWSVVTADADPSRGSGKFSHVLHPLSKTTSKTTTSHRSPSSH